MKIMNNLITIIIGILLLSEISFAEGINVEIGISQSFSLREKTVKTKYGRWVTVPDKTVKPKGNIKVNSTINGESKSFKTEVLSIISLGEYYFIVCDNGNAFQKNPDMIFINPFVRSMEDYKKLDLNAAKEMYKSGDVKQQELAVWMMWKLDVGQQVSDILQKLVSGKIDEKKQAAEHISENKVYHPLINIKVQSKLLELKYNPGPIDGVLNDSTINTIIEYQKNNNLDITGWLDKATLVKMFTKGR